MSSSRPTSASRQRQAGHSGASDSSSRPRSATRPGQPDPTVLGGIGSMVQSRVGGGSSVGGVNRAHSSSNGTGQGGQGYSARQAQSGAGSAYGQPGYASGRPQSAGAPEGGAGSRYRSASAGPSVGGRSSSGSAASNVATAGRTGGGSGWVEVGSGPGLGQGAGYNTQLRPSTAGMAPGGRSSVGGVYSGLMSPGHGAVPTPSFGKGASSAAELHPHHPQNDISSRLHGSPHHLMPSPYQVQQGQQGQGQGQGGFAAGPSGSGAWTGGLQYAAHGQPQQPQAPYTQPPGPTYGVHSWYTSAASGQNSSSSSGRPGSAGQRPTSCGVGVGGHVHTTPPQRGAGLWSYGSNGAEAPVKVMSTPSTSAGGGGGAYGALLRPTGGPVLATVDALGPAAAALFHQQQAAVHSAQKAAVMTRMPAPAAGTYVSYSSGVSPSSSATRSPLVGSDPASAPSSAAAPVTPRAGTGAWSSPGGRPGSASASGRTLGISPMSPAGQPTAQQQQPVALSGVARPVTPAATHTAPRPGSATGDRSSPRAASPSGASAGLSGSHTGPGAGAGMGTFVAGMGYAEKFSAQQALRAHAAVSATPAGVAAGPILGPDEEDGDDVSLPLGPKTSGHTKQGGAALVVGGHGAGSPPPGEPGLLDGEGDDSPRTSPAPFEPSSAGGYSTGTSSRTGAAGRQGGVSTPTRAGSNCHGLGAATPSGTPGGYAATPNAVSMLGPNSAPSNGGLLASPLNLPQPVMPDFSHLPPEEADAARKAWQRQVQREREWLARQRLKQIVAHNDFDGRATTEFYGFGKVLGQGSFGEVRLAWHRLAGAKVAIKSYEKARLTEPNHWRRVQQEIRLMERLNHPNIIRQLEMIDSMKRIHIVMEFAGGGNLCTYVKSKQKLQEPEARKHFLQLLAAVEYMHDLGIIHRDIKLENVLFDEEQNVKLTDFGFSVAVRDPNKRLKIFCGTPSYMAPEITQRKEYLGRPVDVWSLAVLLYAMLAGHFPFTAKTYPELYKKIAAAQLKFPDHMSSSVRDLLRRMLHPDPLKRLTLAHARMHPWVAPSVASALTPPGQPGDKSLLISDDPSRDVNEAVLQRCEHLGFKRQKVVESILSRAKNAAATVYYLVLARMGRSARATGDGRAETRAADTSSARGGTSGQHAGGAGTSSAVGAGGGSAATSSSGMAPSMPARPSTAVASSRATAAAAQSQAHARAVTSAQIASGRTAGPITGLPLNLTTSQAAGGATGPVDLGAPPAARPASASAGFVVGVHQSGSARSTASGASGGVPHVGHGHQAPSTSSSSGGPLGSSAASDGHFNLIGGLGSVASSTAGSTGAGHAGGGGSFVGILGASPRSERSTASGLRGTTGQGMGMSVVAGEGKLDDSSRASSVGSGRVGPQTGMPPSSYDEQSRISAVLGGSGSSADKSESKAGGGSGAIPARSRSAGPALAAASRPRSAAPGIASGARAGGVLASSGPTAVTQGGIGMGSPTSAQVTSTSGQGFSSIKGPVRATSAALPQGV